MDQEFDRYARQYEDLLQDPIRDAFSANAIFFAERKWMLIQSYFAAQRIDLSRLSWLDVGCGRGELLQFGSPHFGAAAGCDVSAEMLKFCGDIPARQMTDPGRLPYPDLSFDFLTTVCVYHHVPPAERAALTAETFRVLRPGGVFAIIEHNPINPATRAIVRRTPVDQNAILLRAGETQRLQRAAGFQDLRTYYFLYLPEKLYRAVPWMESAFERLPLGGQYAVFGRKR
jgi:SAM-dependent methyltransferase